MRIQEDRCTGCGYCLLICPEGAISSDGWAAIDAGKCTDCNLCFFACPNDALMADVPVRRKRPQAGDHYDAVVIGTGIGGLMAGAALAKEGWEVALFEKLSFVGGRFTEIDHRGYRVTTAAWTSLGKRCHIGRFLEEVGARVEYISLKDLGRSHQSSIRFRDGREYPSLEAMLSPREHRLYLSTMAGRGKEDLRRVSTRAYLERYVQNEDFLATIDAMVGTASGLRIEEFPASEYIQSTIDIVSAGQEFAFPVGGVRSIVEALAQVIRKHGGEIFNAEVSSIVIEDQEAKGVVLLGQTFVGAGAVVHNVGARALVRLVRRDRLPEEYVGRIERLIPMDCAALILGTDVPLLTEAPMLVTPRCDRVVGMFAPTFFDPSVAPPGKHMVDVFFPVHSAHRTRELDLAWGDLRALFPHIDDVLDLAVPMFFTGAWTGAQTAQTFGQVGEERLDPRTPINGLYLVGMDAIGSGVAGDLMPIGVRRMLEYLL